ncbi:hypothetical protein Tco_1156019 [Tanacetum coccineum]
MNPIASQQAALDNSLITAEVPEIYMHQFWNTIKKIGKTDAYEFKLDKKKCRVDTEVFQEDLLTFIKELGYSGKCDMLSTIRTDQMESRAQVLWAMYNQKNVDYVALLWEDFMYQADNREISSARKEHMPYPRFTKVIIDHFISKDNSISMRNRINLHTARDDSLLGALKFVSKTKDCQKYGALIPDGMINDDIKLSTAYKTYLDYATGKVPPKKARKFKKPASPKLKTIPASPKEPTQKGKQVKRPAKKATTALSTGVVIRDTPDKSVSKKIAPTKTDRGKGIELLYDAALLEDAQLKKTLRKSKRETHKLQASGSSEGVDVESEVPDEQIGKTKDTSNSEDENDDFNDEDDDGGNDDDSGSNDDGGNDAQDSEQTDSDDDKNPSFTLKDYEEEEQDEEYVFTLEKDESDDEEKIDTDMTNAEQGGGDQHNASHDSSVSSNFTSKLLNLDNTGLDVNEIASLVNTSTVPPPTPLANPSSHLTTTPQQQTPDSTTTTTNPTITLQKIPNFASIFWFEQRVSALETKLSEFNQTSQFAKAVFSILRIVDQYLASKMKEAVDVAVRLQSNKLKLRI